MKVELEAVNHQDKLPLRVFLHSIRRTSLHCHPELELLFILKGTVSVRIETSTLRPGPGDLVLVNSGVAHLTQEEGGDNLILAVQIDPSFAYKYDAGLVDRHFAFNEFREAAPEAPVFDRIRGICARLLWETRLRRVGYRLTAESLTLEFLSILLREFDSVPVGRPAPEMRGPDMDGVAFYSRLNRVVALIERRYRERLSLTEIARQEGMNMTYLSRFFKEKMGYSFTAFVQFIRLKKTLTELEESDRKIVDIALDCGFPNVKSYNLVFKRTYNRTPAQWRSERKRLAVEINPSSEKQSFSAYGSHDDENALALVRRYLPKT